MLGKQKFVNSSFNRVFSVLFGASKSIIHTAVVTIISFGRRKREMFSILYKHWQTSAFKIFGMQTHCFPRQCKCSVILYNFDCRTLQITVFGPCLIYHFSFPPFQLLWLLKARLLWHYIWLEISDFSLILLPQLLLFTSLVLLSNFLWVGSFHPQCCRSFLFFLSWLLFPCEHILNQVLRAIT